METELTVSVLAGFSSERAYIKARRLYGKAINGLYQSRCLKWGGACVEGAKPFRVKANWKRPPGRGVLVSRG